MLALALMGLGQAFFKLIVFLLDVPTYTRFSMAHSFVDFLSSNFASNFDERKTHFIYGCTPRGICALTSQTFTRYRKLTHYMHI